MNLLHFYVSWCYLIFFLIFTTDLYLVVLNDVQQLADFVNCYIKIIDLKWFLFSSHYETSIWTYIKVKKTTQSVVAVVRKVQGCVKMDLFYFDQHIRFKIHILIFTPLNWFQTGHLKLMIIHWTDNILFFTHQIWFQTEHLKLMIIHWTDNILGFKQTEENVFYHFIEYNTTESLS